MYCVIFEKTGQWLSRSNMQYVTKLCDMLKNLPNSKKGSTFDQVIQFIKYSRYQHMVLFHDPIIPSICNSLQTEDIARVLTVNQKCSYSTKEKKEIDDFVSESRLAFNVQPSQKLAMSVLEFRL